MLLIYNYATVPVGLKLLLTSFFIKKVTIQYSLLRPHCRFFLLKIILTYVYTCINVIRYLFLIIKHSKSNK